jgi:putative spermidine/putrescine transport system ATP-binding protein
MAPPPVAEPALRLDAVRKTFGGVAAVDGISLDVQPGEFVTLLGPSGCGKTTTLNLIAGFEQPDAGHIHLAGRAVEGLPPFRRDIGLVFQDYALFPHMTVADNVGFGLRMRGVDKTEIATRVAEALALVRLPQVGERRPLELSGGQRQRVALARALVIRPTVLLLDEPLSNLDLKLREDMRLEIVGLQRRLGITTVLVTHDQGEALAVSDRIAVMNHGRIEQIGSPIDVYERPATRFVASFMGTTNLVPGVVDVATKAGAICPVRTPGGSLTALTSAAVTAGQPVTVAVRPERLRVVSGSGAQHGMSVTVLQHVYLGNKTEVHVTLADGTRCVLECTNDGQQMPTPVGGTLALTAQATDCRLFPVS